MCVFCNWQKLRAAQEDREFPDEVDTPLDQPARVRFGRYRGLQSFRHTAWDPKEDLPPQYARIFKFKNFDHTRRRVLKELKASKTDEEVCVIGGSKGRVVLTTAMCSFAERETLRELVAVAVSGSVSGSGSG